MSTGKRVVTSLMMCECLFYQGGQFHHEGNVLVEGKPVCDDNWGLRNAAVVCGQLGYPGVEV